MQSCESIGKSEVIEAVYRNTIYSRYDVKRIVNLFLDEIQKNLEERKAVVLSDFATLRPVFKESRKGGYVINGKYSPGKDHYTVFFVPHKSMKEKLIQEVNKK